MSITAPPSGLQPEDFEKIEAAVMETARGRWFLLEYARRQRAAEIDRLIAALNGLEQRLAGQALDARLLPPAAEHVAPRDADLPLAERLQDFAWSLRERGLDEGVCAPLEAMAREALRGATQTQATERDEAAPTPAIACDAPAAQPNLDQQRAPQRTQEAPEPPRLTAPLPKEINAPPSIDPRLEALSEFDRLPLSEKLDLFS